MVVFEVPVNGCNPVTIVLGRRGTYNTQEVTFDLSYLVENYGAGTAALMVKRSQDTSAYPAVVSQEGNTLTWVVSDVDTYYPGSGECELMWYVDEGLAKTIIYTLVVMRDILQTTEEPPDRYENWIEHLTGLGAETQQNAQAAAQSATEAKDSADAAEAALEKFTTPTASATTLEPGAPATAEYNDGNFEFGIPRGETGATGPQGPQGIQGETGPQGPKGDKLTYADLTEADKEDLVQGPIKAAQDTAVEAVNTAGNTQKNAVNQAGATQVNNVNQAGTTQVGNVNQAGTTQIQAVEDKGAEVLETIPADYTELSNAVFSDVTGLDTKAPVIIDTASGAIASFDDGADSMPIRKLVAQIEPVQDLHGYANPWPAGGNGNEWNEDWEAGAINVITGALSSASNAIRSASYSACTPSTEYYLFCGAGSSRWFLGICWYDANQQFISGSYNNRGTVTSPENAAYFKITTNTSDSIYGGTYNNDIAINYPATVTTYSPYSNICPISGHTGAEIEQTGVNVWDEEWEVGGYNLSTGEKQAKSTIRSKEMFPVKEGMSIYVCSPSTIIGLYYYADGTYIGYSQDMIAGSIYIVPAGIRYMNIQLVSAYGTTYNHDISINYPATDTEYHPYTGNQISVTFPDTIYGGEDEVIGGALKADRAIAIFDGSSDENWVKNPSYDNIYYISLPGAKTGSSQDSVIISNYLHAGNVYSENYAFSMGNSFNVRIEGFTSLSEFKSFLSNNNLEVCYALAEPVEYTLTANELTTLYGTNNIWANTGNIQTCEYPADTKLYIDRKIAEALGG